MNRCHARALCHGHPMQFLMQRAKLLTWAPIHSIGPPTTSKEKSLIKHCGCDILTLSSITYSVTFEEMFFLIFDFSTCDWKSKMYFCLLFLDICASFLAPHHSVVSCVTCEMNPRCVDSMCWWTSEWSLHQRRGMSRHILRQSFIFILFFQIRRTHRLMWQSKEASNKVCEIADAHQSF